MYLSRIQLNPARREAQRVLSSPHVLHAAVLAAFPDPSARETGRVLWRLDIAPHRALVYIVSPERPDLTHLAEQAGWPSLEDSWGTRPYDPVLGRIENGHRYRFRLTANPVRSERLPAGERTAGERGKVFGHVTVDQQEQWLLSRTKRLGFEIVAAAQTGKPDFVVSDRRTLTFSRRETRVTLRVATFEGTLAVTDREAFVHTLSHGIGRAKGYGCGLLTIAPAE